MVIGLCGKAGSGKDTTARIIKEFLLEDRGNRIIQTVAFGDKVKEVASALFGVPLEYFYDREYKETFFCPATKEYKTKLSVADIECKDITVSRYTRECMNPDNMFICTNKYIKLRGLLHYVGDFMKRNNENIWIDAVRYMFNNNTNVSAIIISDIRYENELDFCIKTKHRNEHSIIIKLVNTDNPSTFFNHTHSSENDLNNNNIQYVITWNGTDVDYLKRVIKRILTENNYYGKSI